MADQQNTRKCVLIPVEVVNGLKSWAHKNLTGEQGEIIGTFLNNHPVGDVTIQQAPQAAASDKEPGKTIPLNRAERRAASKKNGTK